MGRTRKPKVKKCTMRGLLDEHIFNIPAYQRSYSWGKKELHDLFNDVIENMTKREDLFLSLIVTLYKSNENYGKTQNIVDLVDGQQRITTIILLLKSIYLIKKDLGDIDNSIDDLLIKRSATKTSNVLSQGSHSSSTNLFNYIQLGTRCSGEITTFAQRNLENAIDECYRFIKYSDYYDSKPCLKRDLKSINTIKDILLDDFQLVYYEVPNEKQVYKTFESLNSRGLPVSALDNFKSQLLGIAFAVNDKYAVRELHNIWSNIYNTIGVEKINEDDIISIAATLYKASDDTKSTPKSVRESVDYFYNVATKTIDASAPTVLKHTDPSLDTPGYRCQKISELMNFVAKEMVAVHKDRTINAITDVKQARILLIAIKLSKYNQNDKDNLIKQWERTTFRLFCLHRKDSRSFRGEYINCAAEAINGISVKDLSAHIKDIGSKFKFDDGLKSVVGSAWYPDYGNDVIFIMRRYDEYLAKKAGANISQNIWKEIWESDPSTTIEHIFPKTYPKPTSSVSIKKAFKANWEHGGKRFNQKKLDSFVHNIGNLTVLEPGINSQVGQKSYPEKINQYGNQMRIHPELTSRYLQKGFWTEQSIKEREKEILNFIEKEWKD